MLARHGGHCTQRLKRLQSGPASFTFHEMRFYAGQLIHWGVKVVQKENIAVSKEKPDSLVVNLHNPSESSTKNPETKKLIDFLDAFLQLSREYNQ